VQHDYLGNPVSGDSGATLDAVNDFIGGFLGYEERMLGVIAAADADPDSGLANAYAGWIWMFLEAPAAPALAAKYLTRAIRASATATPRERLITELLGAWCADDVVRATHLADRILALAPRDLAVLKLHQHFSFNRGQSAEMLRVALQALPAAGDVAALHGMAAFAYEQCHLLDEAEAAARTALGLNARDPWAQHALAHVMLGRGRIREGLEFLDSVSGTWTGLTSFMYTHNWWHVALFLISEGRLEEALEVHDRHCWARDREYSQDQVGAISLLARLELAGTDVGGRWQALGPYLGKRRADTVEPLLTLQYLYGLARAGRAEAAGLLAAVRARAASAREERRATWREVALPACEALIAYRRGDYEAARRLLGPTLPRMLEVGGSHAQRDLFAQIYLDCLLRSGAGIAAQQLLEERRRFEPDGVPLNRALARLYAELGLPGEAAKAAARCHRPPRHGPR
jgi:tetratricopeptide (TPR) repeat protein